MPRSLYIVIMCTKSANSQNSFFPVQIPVLLHFINNTKAWKEIFILLFTCKYYKSLLILLFWPSCKKHRFFTENNWTNLLLLIVKTPWNLIWVPIYLFGISNGKKYTCLINMSYMAKWSCISVFKILIYIYIIYIFYKIY